MFTAIQISNGYPIYKSEKPPRTVEFLPLFTFIKMLLLFLSYGGITYMFSVFINEYQVDRLEIRFQDLVPKHSSLVTCHERLKT